MLTATTTPQHTTSQARPDGSAETPKPARILLVATADLDVANLPAATLKRLSSEAPDLFVVVPATPPAAAR